MIPKTQISLKLKFGKIFSFERGLPVNYSQHRHKPSVLSLLQPNLGTGPKFLKNLLKSNYPKKKLSAETLIPLDHTLTRVRGLGGPPLRDLADTSPHNSRENNLVGGSGAEPPDGGEMLTFSMKFE